MLLEGFYLLPEGQETPSGQDIKLLAPLCCCSPCQENTHFQSYQTYTTSVLYVYHIFKIIGKWKLVVKNSSNRRGIRYL